VLAHDLRFALRALRRAPTFTITAIVILSVGIGMAVAMFAVFQSVLIRRLPVRDQDRVAVMWTYRNPTVEFSIGMDDLLRLRAESRTMRAIGGVAHWGANPSPLVVGEGSLVLNRALVTGNFFDVLGVKPTLGRLIRQEDEGKGAPPVIVLSYSAWQRFFGGDSSVIGRRFTEPYLQATYTVVGVAPPGLDYPAGVQAWIPVWRPGNVSMIIVARLAPNATLAAARAEVTAIAQRLQPAVGYTGTKATTFPESVVGDVKPVLVIITAAVALLLLIACVNVGNLVLFRAGVRARELVIRRALGASSVDIARQVLVESVLLAAGGGLLGCVGGDGLIRLLLAAAPRQLPQVDVIGLGGVPVILAVLVTLATVVLFGLTPAILAARGSVASPLRFDRRAGTETRQRRRVRRSLVASQIALAVVLLAGAGLLVRSLARLQEIQLGYDVDHVSLLSVAFSGPKYAATAPRIALNEELLRGLQAIPGVTGITPILVPPFIGANVWHQKFDAEGQSADEAARNPTVPMEGAGTEYFRVLGIPIQRGRGFLETDREDSLNVVVSESVARRFWPNEDPLGKRIRLSSSDVRLDSAMGAWRTVVGVVSDVHLRNLRETTSMVYFPWRQLDWQGMYAVRSALPLDRILGPARRVAREVDPSITIWQAQTMDHALAEPLAQPRMSAVLLSSFGVVALVLAAVGLYGVMASSVREQTRELGVRAALGASPDRLRREVLAQALMVTGAGALVGTVTALGTSRLMRALLFEVSPADPIALVGACVVLLVVALLAAYLPARRATAIDPATALRAE
jgi:putative ABC transport system permease protein